MSSSIASALVWSFFHLPTGASHFLELTFAGLVLSRSVEVSRSLVPAAVAHSAFGIINELKWLALVGH